MLGAISGFADRMQQSIKNAAAMKGNRDILEGKVCAMLLVAYADGSCTDAEENEAMTTLTQDKQLEAAGFTAMDIAEAWTKFRDKRPGSFTGKMQLRREISEAVGRAQKAKLTTVGEDIFLGSVNVAFSDGNAAPEERAELKQIATACSLSESKIKEMVGDALN